MFDRDNQPERSVAVSAPSRRPAQRRARRADAGLFQILLEKEGVGLRGRVTPGQGEAPNVFALA